MNTLTVTVTVPEGAKAGDTFDVEVELPKKAPRGQLAGIALEGMTDEQLKRELINAGSVLYKAIKRGASDETIRVNQERVDAAKAERDRRIAAVRAEKDAAKAAKKAEKTNEQEVPVDSESTEVPESEGTEVPTKGKKDKKSKKAAE